MPGSMERFHLQGPWRGPVLEKSIGPGALCFEVPEKPHHSMLSQSRHRMLVEPARIFEVVGRFGSTDVLLCPAGGELEQVLWPEEREMQSFPAQEDINAYFAFEAPPAATPDVFHDFDGFIETTVWFKSPQLRDFSSPDRPKQIPLDVLLCVGPDFRSPVFDDPARIENALQMLRYLHLRVIARMRKHWNEVAKRTLFAVPIVRHYGARAGLRERVVKDFVQDFATQGIEVLFTDPMDQAVAM